jgi:hypothetical protein
MGQNGSVERRHSWNAALRERFRQLEHRWYRSHPPIAIVDPADSPQADDRDEWKRFGISEDERCLFEQRRPNVLIIGSGPGVDRLVHLLERTCVPPIIRCTSSPLTLPTSEVGTLAVSNAEQLNPMDQQLLFAWLSCMAPRRQVITTAAVPLFPAVVRNTFSDALFYRLNAMCLMLRDAPVAPRARNVSHAR